MKKHPIVVLVGRPNVGKSALFNRIANTIRALIYDQPGVTRDILQDICTWHDTTFTIVDTPGLDSLLHQKDSITQEAIIEAEKTTQNASLIVYVIDGKEGITKTDEILLRKFQKLQKPICIALNKTDIKDAEDTRYDIKGLGFSEITSVSASHGKGISDLLDSIIYIINTNTNYNNEEINLEQSPEQLISSSVAFLGRPNVGKSSILNAILNKKRSIVSPIAGTTREAVYETFNHGDIEITLADTAGVRRSRAINDRLEELMVSNTMSALDRASIVVMILDISENALFDQDIKLLLHAYQTMKKGVLIIWNKIDLIQSADRIKHVKFITQEYSYIFDLLPQLFVSAEKKINIEKIIPHIVALHKRYFQRFNSEIVSNTLREAVHKKPLFKSEQVLKIYKAEVIRAAPPTIVIYTQQKSFFSDTQFNFLDKVMRKKFNLLGVPTKWIPRDN